MHAFMPCAASSGRAGATLRLCRAGGAIRGTVACCSTGGGDVASTSGRRHVLCAAPGLLALVAALPSCAKQTSGDWSSPGLAAPEDEAAPKFFKTADGVKVQELLPGSGPAARPGDGVLIDYVLRRANGYFIYATVEGVSFQPKDVPVGPVLLQLGSGKVVPGLEEALVGMAQGAKRRILVPPELGYTQPEGQLPEMPTFATKRQLSNHAREPLLFEVQLLRVRPSQ